MSLVIDGKRSRQDTGVQDRKVAGEIFAGWQVQLARERWLGLGQHDALSRDRAESGRRGAAAPWLRDVLVVGVDTGLRRSNLVGLQWSWVQEQGTVLLVPRQHMKGKKATVLIPLTTRAAAIIQRQVRHLTSPHVFTQPDGRAYSLEQVGMAVIRAATQAQLPGVSLHTLRHTFISRLVQAGRPLPEVAALAGHREIKMTLRYAHLAPSHLRAGIQALEQRSLRQPTTPTLSTDLHVTQIGRAHV